MVFKKILTFAMAAVLLLTFTACEKKPGANGTEQPQSTTTPVPTPTQQAPWGGNLLTFNGERVGVSLTGAQADANAFLPTFTVEGEAAITFENTSNPDFNYYSLLIKSSAPLWGYITYEKDGQDHEELFFIEASEEPIAFNSYVDGFMNEESGKNVKQIRFINKGEEDAQIELTSITTEKKPQIQERIYLDNGVIKIGATLLRGGGLDYFEYIKEPVAAVEKNGRVEVGKNYASQPNDRVLTEHVNFFNHYDTGRLVQQSYYGTSQAPYEPGEFMGRPWPYNPVMGGDRGNTPSKIIDFVQTETSIYVKCRPMDWGKVNEPTLSYMEATYTLEDNTLRVYNRFVDFSGYRHVSAQQELPAFYVIEPLYRLAYYEGKNTWSDEPLTFKDDLPFWDGIWPNFRSRECWWAWVNGDETPFGLGLFVPEVTNATGGIFQHDGNIKDDPAASNPTSYIAPLKTLTLKSYKPLEYTYLVTAGTLDEIRATFKEKKDTIDNSVLKSYR